MNTKLSSARLLTALALPALILLLVACGGQTQDDARQPETPAAAADASALDLAGVIVTPPPGWRDLGPSGMRQAQFHLAPQADDQEPAEVAVFYFGPDSGGGVEANLQRWLGQMSLPDGGEVAAAATRDQFTAGGMAAHLVAVDGTYHAAGMGGPMAGSGEPRTGYRLVGVVLEGPRGNLFFKLTGPRATAVAMEAGLLEMVRGARAGG
jgi:hypothetical protein